MSMEDESDERTRVLMDLNNAIGTAGYGKANELVEAGELISTMDLAAAFIFCAYRTIDELPEKDRTTGYVEILSYLCMIGENETKEDVFKFILNILEGYMAAGNHLTKEDIMSKLFPSNGKSRNS